MSVTVTPLSRVAAVARGRINGAPSDELIG